MIRICVQIHFTICKEIGVKFYKECWCERTSKFVETSYEIKVTKLWDEQVKSDGLIPHNKPRHNP
jgi:hypothetical protein